MLHCYCELRPPPLKPSDWQLCSACNSVGGSALWGGCHWYPLCNFLLAGGWWLWLNLGFSPCHQHYCTGIPRVPALRILCHILSCQLWTLPAGPVARHNTDYLSPKRAPPPLCYLSLFSPPFPPSISHHFELYPVIQHQAFYLFKSSAVLSLESCICPSCFADQLCSATGGGRRVTPGLRCNLRGRPTWVLVITAKCLGRADLFSVGVDWDSG